MINPNDIHIDYAAHQPIGGYGFRKGKWSVLYNGQKYTVFTSVPHAIELEEQYRMVKMAAARHIAKLLATEGQQ